MKYPNIIVFRYKKYAATMDTYFETNKEAFNCNIHIITDSKQQLLKLFDSSYHLLVTLGPVETEYFDDVNSMIVSRMRKRWIHYTTLPQVDAFNSGVNFCYMHNITLRHELTRPGFSVMTTCYNSYEKIHRAYDSLKVQNYRDWEWVILDDSPTDAHFNFLKRLFKNDSRVRLYKRSENSGNIGNVKNEATSLCRGQYVLELDHDDEILPDTLKDAVKVFEDDADVGFVYTDFINIYENGKNFRYSDFISKGYGGYYCEKFLGKWRFVYNTPQINNITLSHIVSVPNHPRIWRASTLHEIGNYCEFLPICDDHELLIRTAVNTTMAKIPKIGYVQYMNEGNNNFSLIRNSEINRISPGNLFRQCYDVYKVHARMKELDAYENESYLDNHVKLWKRGSEYQPKYCNKLINLNFTKQYCILDINWLYKNLDKIRELYKIVTYDFIVLDIKHDITMLCAALDKLDFSRMKCYYMNDVTMDEMEAFFHTIYRSCDNYEILKESNDGLSIVESVQDHSLDQTQSIKPITAVKYNTQMTNRYEIINKHTKPEDLYVEIGVEYGTTFQHVHFNRRKIGVDPDPKFEDPNLIIAKSNDFFETCDIKPGELNAIFIDGMHQAEYILDDINNSLKILCIGGVMMLDDILPANYNEQLKIPNKHYYENNILKYGEPWTGDIWKVVFYILKNYADKFTLTVYNNPCYRGVGVFIIKELFEIPADKIDEINGYSYYDNFNEYTELMNSII